MNVTVEIPDDRAARFEREAKARGLTLNQWLLALADQNASTALGADRSRRTLADICAKVRGLAEDIDFGRDSSSGRSISL